MPYSPIKIANELIRRARNEGKALTPLQLIKLTYISHGWSFPILGQPLLNEPAQAWTYGPVIPSLYFAIRSYRAQPVRDEIPGDTDPQNLTEDELSLISSVYERYKHMSGTQLSALTHMPGTPWSTVWEAEGQNAVIPDQLIARHYAERLAEPAVCA